MIAGDMIRFGLVFLLFTLSFSQGSSKTNKKVSVFNFLGKDMGAKQHLKGNAESCTVSEPIFSNENLLETAVTIFRATLGGYEVSTSNRYDASV